MIDTREVLALSQEDIEVVLAQFTGEITQVPSMFSALKHNGQPLYKLARAGIEVERKPRKAMIYQLNLSGFTHDTVSLHVECSKGTYIRTLVEDIGDKLGCGAHVVALRRVGIRQFTINQMRTMEIIETQGAQVTPADYQPLDKNLLSIETMLPETWPRLMISDAAKYYLTRGQAICVPRAPSAGWVKLLARGTEVFLGVGEVLSDGRVTPKRLVRQADGA